MDPRLTPANDYVAHERLRGTVEAPAYTTGTWHRIQVGAADLLRTPGGARNRQVIFGERVLCLDKRDGYAFIEAEKDGYVGYVHLSAIGDDAQATHWVSGPSSHLYPAPDFKQHEVDTLTFGARVNVIDTSGRFAQTDTGHFIPKSHLTPVGEMRPDIVATAELFLGSPYLWGGNTRSGIDCSGIVQSALLACWPPLPRRQ